MKNKFVKRLTATGAGLIIGLILAEASLRTIEAVSARRVPSKKYHDRASADALHMALLGGSTSGGTPFSDAMADEPGKEFNLLSVTEFLLEKRYGYREVEVDGYAGPNWSAETTIEHYFERPDARPDILVLYAGQNETTRYYSPNMTPPPSFLTPLARLKFGSLLLRRLFTSQVTPADQRYAGQFFSENVIPKYERMYNVARYRKQVERLIRYAKKEEMPLIVVIPQSNYLFPPTRSVYEGPIERQEEALELFKQAWSARHLEDRPDQALSMLGKLSEFCSFADLFFELGELHYSRGEFETALAYLRRARDADGFPTSITQPYREALAELVKKHDVPHIDMDELIRRKIGKPVPDYSSFYDDCHLRPHVYLALSQEIIRVMGVHGFDKLDMQNTGVTIAESEWSDNLGLTPQIRAEAVFWEADYHVGQARYAYLKLRNLSRAEEYLQRIKDVGSKEVTDGIEEVTREIRAERARMARWVRHEGAMPIGPPIGEVGEPDFGGGAEIEAAQGDLLGRHGEYELSVRRYRAALEMDPMHIRARANLGVSLYRLKRFDEAIEEFERVLVLDPSYLKTRRDLGKALFEMGRFDEAVVQYREAVRLAPGVPAALQDYCVVAARLAWELATDPDPANRDGARAVVLAEEVVKITSYKALDALDVLAAAYAEMGRFEDAVVTASNAIALARQHSHPMESSIAERLELYKAGKPWRQK